MRSSFIPVTPTQQWLVRYTELTKDLDDAEIREILIADAPCGKGFKGWWKGLQIRIAFDNLEYYRELARE